jgi:hypothetical protein
MNWRGADGVRWGVRQIVFEYNSSRMDQDVEEDPMGVMAIPDIGAILSRHGREWKVVSIRAPADSEGFAPVVRIFLSQVNKHPSSVKHLPR